MVANWIINENLQVFLELLAEIAGTRLKEWDFNAIKSGLVGTNEERDVWLTYKIEGKKRTLSLQAADDPGSIVYHFRIAAEEPCSELIELAFFAVQGTVIKPVNPYD